MHWFRSDAYGSCMDLIVRWDPAGWSARLGERAMRCAVGRSGACRVKREGDGMTPVGRWPFRSVLFRADRGPAPRTSLACRALSERDGWCDDPGDAAYNRRVPLPHGGRHEKLWRDDRLYDLIAVLGHNDDPPRPGCGSAIFLHLARSDWGPTEGCVALARPDLLAVLRAVGPDDAMTVETEGPPGSGGAD